MNDYTFQPSFCPASSSMSSPPLHSSATGSVSLVGTAVVSMAFGALSTAYIMKRYYSSSPDADGNKRSALSRRRRPSSDCSSNNSISDHGDEVAPLEKMQKRLSECYNIQAGRRSILLSEEDNSSISSPRRLHSSITRDSGIDSHYDSLTSGCSSDLNVRPHSPLQLQRSRSLETFDSKIGSKSSKIVTREESYISETEMQFKGEEGFGESILQNVKNLPDSLRLLRRTRAISALASRLMEARDEAECIEEVSRLLALMFDLDRVSFGMVTGTDNFLIKRVLITRNPEKGDLSTSSSFELEVMDSDFERPLEGTACGVVCKTLREHYAPRTNESPFDTHKALYEIGFKSTLTSPILVNGKKCAGAILIPRKEEDGFSKESRVLISDIACILGSNLYSKRLRKSTEQSNKLSRDILKSFVPPKVLEKIECYWNEPKKSDIRRRSIASSSYSSEGSNLDDEKPRLGSNAWYVANADWSEAKADKKLGRRSTVGAVNNGIQSKLQLLRNMNRQDDDSGNDDVGVIVQESGGGLDLSPTRALYAENAQNVCIVFTDIVGFSRISLDIAPIKVMDMLQNLFNRFDELCDLHGVMKLETIGDAYICATNLLEDGDDDDDDGEEDNNRAKSAAIRALAIAKDMVCEARNVSIPCPMGEGGMHDAWVGQNAADFETLEIRVGIHCGDVTCGVLGQKMPKFMTCGTAVNMAARMEQTSLPSMIRTTREFHDLVGDAETNWAKKEVIQLKNMGEMETYLLDPISYIHFE
jgi:class 3 adenylate cyclase